MLNALHQMLMSTTKVYAQQMAQRHRPEYPTNSLEAFIKDEMMGKIDEEELDYILNQTAEHCRALAKICDDARGQLLMNIHLGKDYVKYVKKHYLHPDQLLRKDADSVQKRVECYWADRSREDWRREIHERITDYMECQEAIRNQRLFPMTPKGFHEYIHHNSHAYACTHFYGSRCDKLKPNRVFYGEKRKKRHIEYAD